MTRRSTVPEALALGVLLWAEPALPADTCPMVPTRPTFTSVMCPLAVQLVRVKAEPDLGPVRPELVRTLTKSWDQATEARDLCARSNSRKTKSRLKQAERGVTLYVHRLRRLGERRDLDGGLATRLLVPMQRLRDDLKTLRRLVRCPNDAADVYTLPANEV